MAAVDVVRNFPAVVPPVKEEDEEEEKEAVWLKEIEEVAVQYVSLILEADGRGEMGGGKSPASLLSTVTPLSDGQSPALSSNAPEVPIDRAAVPGFSYAAVHTDCQKAKRHWRPVGCQSEERDSTSYICSSGSKICVSGKSSAPQSIPLPHLLLHVGGYRSV